MYTTHTVAIASTIKALIHRTAQSNDTKLLTILSSVPLEDNAGWVSQPLRDVFKEEDGKYDTLHLEPWTTTEAKQYLDSKEYTFGFADELIKMTNGRPGFCSRACRFDRRR